MKGLRVTVIVPILAVLVGCSSHVSSIRYEPQGTADAQSEIGSVFVGAFVDERGTDSRWLGAIRGGYGNVLKKLYSDEPTSLAVRTAFVDAFAARGIETASEGTKVAIQGTIQKMDCSYFFNREAHVHVEIEVISLPSRSVIHTQTYKTDNTEAGVGAGIFGDPKHLAEFAQRTLNETIDQVFSDDAFVAALKVRVPAQDSDISGATFTERLKELDKLREEGLVSDEEYKSKRKQLLEQL